MPHITANDLKTRGIAAIEASLTGGRTEAIVSVRGTERFVVMEVAHYQHLRECELEAALAESRADIAAGRFVTEPPADHVARLKKMIAADAASEPAAAAQTKARRSSASAAAHKPAKARAR